jgi:hypothetical protein
MSGFNEMKLQTERIKVLKVVGEDVAQIVVEGQIPINAIKIVKIHATLRNVETEVFENKVVIQGIIHKQVFYVDPENFVRHIPEDIPFMTYVDIPGVHPNPFEEVQVHLLDIDTNFHLEPPKQCGYEPGDKGHGKEPERFATLQQKVVAHILVKVSKWTQLDVVTNMQIFPRSLSRTNVVRCQ